MLTKSDLLGFIDDHGVEGEIISLPAHTLTVEEAARALHTKPENILKSLLFLVDGKPLLALANGNAHIDPRAIAARFGVGRKRVKLAAAETVLEVTGYPVGTVPPFGHRQSLPTLIDKRVLEQPLVYAGGGEVDALLHIRPREIARIAGAIEVDLIRSTRSGSS